MFLKEIAQALKPKVKTCPTSALSKAYKELVKVFSLEKANKLSPHHPGVNYTIHMQPGTQLPAGPLYSMSRDKLQVLKKYLEDNLSKRFIQVSSLPTAASVNFVQKSGNGL